MIRDMLSGLSRSQRLLTALCLTTFVFFCLLYPSLQSRQFIEYLQSDVAPALAPAAKPANNYAFITFLGAYFSGDTANDDDDNYFVATRMLNYQLLHDPPTRTNSSYSFIVLVTDEVKASKRARLSADGATVIVVKRLALDWGKTPLVWHDVLTKLRLFELVQYDKLLYLDADTLLTRPMDGIFDDPAAAEQNNLHDANPDKVRADEAPQPATYVFAGNAGAGSGNHSYPPAFESDNLNAGCMVFRPSRALFDYYVSIARLEDRFNARYPEQSLWGYAHRRTGNMPWKQLHWSWNTNRVTYEDYRQGIASLHVKWWDECDSSPLLRDWAMGIRWRMQGYWQGVQDAR